MPDGIDTEATTLAVGVGVGVGPGVDCSGVYVEPIRWHCVDPTNALTRERRPKTYETARPRPYYCLER